MSTNTSADNISGLIDTGSSNQLCSSTILSLDGNWDPKIWNSGPILEVLDEMPSTKGDRSIVFVVDIQGNQGKTWFAHWYASSRDRAQVIVPGKKADMVYTFDLQCRVYIFDAPRSKQGEFIQYDLLEEIKNGYVFVNKYQSHIVPVLAEL